jgi:hypothetical protein
MGMGVRDVAAFKGLGTATRPLALTASAASIPKMDKFAAANLTELQEQIKKSGLNVQANRLGKSKEHANALSGAYDVANGKYASGIYRLLMQNPRESWPGFLVMMAGHGMKMPFPLPQITGAIVASGHIGRLARKRAANVTQELKATLPEEYFRTRTQAEEPETFTYKNPDDGWSNSPAGEPMTPAEKAAAIRNVKRARGQQ